MAAFELLLSHARRQSLLLLRSTSSSSLHSSQSRHLTSSSPLLGFQRLFSTSDSPSEDQEPPKPPLIKTVSYPVKPKDPETSTKTEHQPEFRRPREERRPRENTRDMERRPRENTRDNNMNTRQESQETETQTETNAEPPRSSWSREDARYMKDVPIITPVSYPVKVAPLPEDDVAVKKEQEESRRENEQLEKEKRRIQMDARLKRSLRHEEEKSLPFPSLIKVEKKKSKVPFDLQDALREVKANAKCDFVETVEAHVGLSVDPRRGDQMVRGAATLPHGTGKVVRVAVFAEGEVAEVAREAGADVVGADELIEEIRKGGGKLNFDKCISTPLFMPRLGKIARILGPRGLMPNPKLGSVTSDVAGAVREAKRGRIDFKIDKTAIVHVGLGKVNFSEEALRENICAFVHALLVAKPAGLKKTSKYAGYVKSFSLASTMGPGFPVSLQSLTKAAEDYIKLQVK